MLTIGRNKKKKESSAISLEPENKTFEKESVVGTPKQSTKLWMKTRLRPRKSTSSNVSGGSSMSIKGTSKKDSSQRTDFGNQSSSTAKGTLTGFNKLALAKNITSANANPSKQKKSMNMRKKQKAKTSKRKKKTQNDSIYDFTDAELDTLSLESRHNPEGEQEKLEEMSENIRTSFNLRGILNDFTDESTDLTHIQEMYKKGTLYHEESTRLLRTSAPRFMEEEVDLLVLSDDEGGDEDFVPAVPPKIRKNI